MGGLCGNAKLNEIDEILLKPDIVFDSFSSSKDKKFTYEKIMKILKTIPLNEFLQIVFSLESERKDHSIEDLLNVDMVPAALKNKVFKHPLVSENTSITEKDIDEFSSFIIKYLDFAGKNYKGFMKTLGIKVSSKELPKLALLTLSFLYSADSQNSLKINLMFNILSENGKLKQSNNLLIFVFFCMSSCTNILLLTINEIAKENPNIRKLLSEDDFIELYKMFEVKDSISIANKYCEELFTDGKEIALANFEDIIIKKKLYWIFDPSGVRLKFEKYNETADES